MLIDQSKLSAKVRKRYKVVGNALRHIVKDDQEDRLIVEIGDTKQPDKFYPQVKICRWGDNEETNEVNASFRRIDNEPKTLTTEGEKIKLVGAKKEVHLYGVAPNEELKEGGYEFEVILKEKPDSNILQFSLVDKDVEYFYQPPLNQEKLPPNGVYATETDVFDKDGGSIAHRPENVVGSYAVYTKTPKHNFVGGKKYRCGKVGHIYRPKIVDNTSNWVWGELNVDVKKGILTVTIPQEFLDTAVYPVRHATGLTFGYTGGGASQGTIWDYDPPSCYIRGGNFALGEAGTATSITAYIKRYDQATKTKCAIYDNSKDLVEKTEEKTDTGGDGWQDIWRTHNLDSPQLLASANFWLLIKAEGSTNVYLRYDSTGSGAYANIGDNYDAVWPNPFSEDDTDTNKYSIYCTYTAVGQQPNSVKANIAEVLSEGPNSPGTVVDDSSVGSVAWSNPDNAKSSDNIYATTPDIDDYTLSHYLKATNFGFSIPNGATINGILVEFEVKEAVGSDFVASNQVRIVKGGSVGTTNKGDWSVEWPTSDTYKSYGSSGDLWGEAWTSDDINSTDFGVVLQISTNDYGGVAYVDHIRITVYYTEAGPTYDNSSKANILRIDEEQNNSSKASIVRTESHENSSKASIAIAKTQNLSVKGNILRTYPKDNFAKAEILTIGQQPNSTKSNILQPNKTYNNSVKQSILVEITKDSFSLAKIEVVGQQPNSAKANIFGPQSHDNSAKAFLYAAISQNNSSKSNIEPAFVNKHYDYRVYDSGTYVTTWSDEVLSEPSFRMVINGGASEVVVRLNRKFDDFGEEVDVKLFNRVEIWCFDRQAPNGVLLYSGYISGYRPVLEEHREFIEVTILPYVVELSKIMYRDGNGTTEIHHNSVDPSIVFKDIINRYVDDGGTIKYYTTTISGSGGISSNTDSIVNTNTTVSYVYNLYTAKEALDKAIELAPEHWFWRVDPDNIIYLKESDLNTADHTLLVGKHITGMETWRRAEDLVNRVYFVGEEDTQTGEQMYRVYSNTGSIDSYGINAEKKVDQRVSVELTADIMANRILNQKKDPEIRTTLTIPDDNGSDSYKGYDIESIKPGQTIRIKNLKQPEKTVSYWDQAIWDVDVWDQTLSYSAADIIQIQSVEYAPDGIRIEASSRLPEIPKRIEDIARNIEGSQSLKIPMTPTEG